MGKKIKSAVSGVVNVATLGLVGDGPIPNILDTKTPKVGSAQGSIAAPASTPTAVSDETLAARESQRKRQLASAGLSGTNLTGASGLSTMASTSIKTLLGS
jgi:hypothetical protein